MMSIHNESTTIIRVNGIQDYSPWFWSNYVCVGHDVYICERAYNLLEPVLQKIRYFIYSNHSKNIVISGSYYNGTIALALGVILAIYTPHHIAINTFHSHKLSTIKGDTIWNRNNFQINAIHTTRYPILSTQNRKTL